VQGKRPDGAIPVKSTIRLKTILSILPVMVAALAAAGSMSVFSARSGMIRLATRQLAFKAETLKQYAESQWNLLVSQGFSEDADFRLAAERSIGAKAKSLLRLDSEWFLALDLDGRMVMSERLGDDADTAPPGLTATMRDGVTGALSFDARGGRRYGQAFYFEPFGWYVVASETADSIFQETDRMTVMLLAIVGVSTAVAAGLIVWQASGVTGPIVRLGDAMTDVLASNDFGRAIRIDDDDEIGALTAQFNALCREIDRSYRRIGDIAVREAKARTEIVERDIEALVALGKVAEFRDEETSAHTVRVGLYASLLAERFYPDEESRRVVTHAAPLHDLGKIGVPDAILLKPGRLDPDEMRVMRGHAVIGYEILAEFKNAFLSTGATIARSHHERYDGAGYPDGLAGDAIPLCGRILAVVDVFDALTSKRPYKEAWPVGEAFDYLADNRGGQFDPDVVDEFLARRDEVLAIIASNQGEG